MDKSTCTSFWEFKSYASFDDYSYVAKATILKSSPKKLRFKYQTTKTSQVRLDSLTENPSASQAQMDHKAPKLTEATGDRAIGGERAEQFVPKLTSLSTSRSRNFITYLLNWLKVMHVMAAIRAIKVSRPLTKFFLATIFKDWLEKKYTKDDFRGLKLLYIYELIPDEVSKSLTVVADLEKKQTIYAGRGQGERALKGFWKALGSRGAKKIKALAMDMDREHISQTKKRCPNVVFVFERFRLGKRTNFKGLGEGL